MTIRLLTICLHLTFAYWMSSHIAVHNMLFYPTLGAFSYFFISRKMTRQESFKVIAAAVGGKMATEEGSFICVKKETC